jgi:pyruvate dehydrogenase E2 component (dihydrolipoamide acetyltransferase)
MEVPSPVDGVVVRVLINTGDPLQEGCPMFEVEVGESAPTNVPVPVPPSVKAEPVFPEPATPIVGQLLLQDVLTPDLGTDSAEVIEILVQPGQNILRDTPVLVLESAKASMEVPSPVAGVVREIAVRVGDKVMEGRLLLRVETEAPASRPLFMTVADDEPAEPVTQDPVTGPESGCRHHSRRWPAVDNDAPLAACVHCGPAVRRLARELGVDLGRVQATGPKGRILKEDVHGWVRQTLSAPPPSPIPPVVESAAAGLPPLPDIDFTRWGEVEVQPLSRIQALSARNLHRAWLHIPHVTQFDEADITALEEFRKAQKDVMKKQGVNLTVLAFLVKACAHVLQEFPRFNASLGKDSQSLILKRYIHIGVAVDTPSGLVVPVIRDADSKTVRQIALEMADLSTRARDKKLTPAEMQGGTFSISSLGGIGGTAFTPIVNWPEVAILGVSRSVLKPVWAGAAFEPRLLLPLSLSYDHRVIDGADAARFTTRLSALLADIRMLLL